MVALFSFVTYLPHAFSIFFGPYIDKLHDKKHFLVLMEILQIVISLLFILVFHFKISIYLLLFLYLAFAFVNALSKPVEFSILPSIIEDRLDDAVRYTVASGHVLDILSNTLASFLIASFAIINLLLFDFLTFMISTILFISIKLPKKHEIQTDTTQEITYLSTIKEGVRHFFSSKDAFTIISIEGVLNGLTTMSIGILPVYLLGINFDLKYLGIVIALQKLSELLGTFFSKYLKTNFINFFIVDYFISGLCFIGIILIDNIIVKSVLFATAFFVIGLSGATYGQMIYERYSEKYLGRINTIITSILTVLIPIMSLIPTVYTNVSVLIFITGSITILAGGLLLILRSSLQSVPKDV